MKLYGLHHQDFNDPDICDALYATANSLHCIASS